MNAHMILVELTENETTFGKLIQRENVVKLMEAACDLQNTQNQSYALAVLTHIIKEYPDYERSIDKVHAAEFQQTIGLHFHDLTYTCLLTISTSDENLGAPAPLQENQSGVLNKRFGMRRMRSLELLRQELHSISKYAELNAIQQISIVLRRHIIRTMLDVVENYQYCSAACYEAIEVLDILKIAFDDDDVETMKEFVRTHLNSQKVTHFKFESGRHCTNSNLATIIKIGLALKRIIATGDSI